MPPLAASALPAASRSRKHLILRKRRERGHLALVEGETPSFPAGRPRSRRCQKNQPANSRSTRVCLSTPAIRAGPGCAIPPPGNEGDPPSKRLRPGPDCCRSEADFSSAAHEPEPAAAGRRALMIFRAAARKHGTAAQSASLRISRRRRFCAARHNSRPGPRAT